MKLIALGLLGLGLVSDVKGSLHNVRKNIRKNFGNDRLVEVAPGHLTADVVDVLQSFQADHFGTSDTGRVSFKLTTEAVRALESQNINFKDTTEDFIAEVEKNFADENFMCFGDNCHKRDLQSFYGDYQGLDALQNRARDLVSGVNFANIGSVGQSYEGRDMMTVEIGEGNKPLVFYFCNIHAREWLPAMFCIYMAEMLIADGGHPLLDTFDFTILLTANPDGYVYSYTTDNLWRKTRRPNPGSRCIGTDPNRNYDSYHCGAGTSNDPCDLIYCGPRPWTEIEVANIRDFGLANQNRLISMNDVHAKGQMWMFPYGAIRSRPADFTQQNNCARAARDGIRNVHGDNWEFGTVNEVIYPAAGVSVDWFYDTIGVKYAYTAELRGPGNSWQPATRHILLSNQEVFGGVVSALECIASQEGLVSTPAPVPTVRPPPTQSPIPAPTPDCIFFC